MFKEILILFVAMLALTMAYPEERVTVPEGLGVAHPHPHPRGGEGEGLKTAESAHPDYYYSYRSNPYAWSYDWRNPNYGYY